MSFKNMNNILVQNYKYEIFMYAYLLHFMLNIIPLYTL